MDMMRTFYNLLLITIFFSLLTSVAFSQQEDYQVGLNPNALRQTQGAYYDYSDPDAINIKVSIWGYVRFPGRYVIPQRSDIKDLISYAGGVDDDAYLDDLRIYRLNPDSSQALLKFNYEDLWWSEDLQGDLKLVRMEAGDVLIVPGRPKLYWENYLSLGLSILGVLLSVATIIITANK